MSVDTVHALPQPAKARARLATLEMLAICVLFGVMAGLAALALSGGGAFPN